MQQTHLPTEILVSLQHCACRHFVECGDRQQAVSSCSVLCCFATLYARHLSRGLHPAGH